MNKRSALALAAILALSATTAGHANTIDALDAASSVSISAVAGNSSNILIASAGRVMEPVDLETLRARVQSNRAVAAQLKAFGVTPDDVIGVSGTNGSDVTIYVRK